MDLTASGTILKTSINTRMAKIEVDPWTLCTVPFQELRINHPAGTPGLVQLDNGSFAEAVVEERSIADPALIPLCISSSTSQGSSVDVAISSFHPSVVKVQRAPHLSACAGVCSIVIVAIFDPDVHCNKASTQLKTSNVQASKGCRTPKMVVPTMLLLDTRQQSDEASLRSFTKLLQAHLRKHGAVIQDCDRYQILNAQAGCALKTSCTMSWASPVLERYP